jgi:hypothetical protein
MAEPVDGVDGVLVAGAVEVDGEAAVGGWAGGGCFSWASDAVEIVPSRSVAKAMTLTGSFMVFLSQGPIRLNAWPDPSRVLSWTHTKHSGRRARAALSDRSPNPTKVRTRRAPFPISAS